MNGVPHVLFGGASQAARQEIAEMLKDEPWQFLGTGDGAGVIELVRSSTADVVLLDSSLGGLGGLEVCRRLRRDARHHLTPIVLISSIDDLHSRVDALEAGADDFISRPIDRTELLARVRSLLRVKSMRDRLEDTRQVIFALAKAAEAKDRFTVKHAERVSRNASMLASRAGLGEDMIEQVRIGGLIHDVGKIAVSDAVLNKPGALTEAEMEMVRRHPVVGAEIVAPLTGQPDVIAIVRSHHERIDGRGYPDGLGGDAIPLSARIVAICDAFDAMVNERPYRPAMSAADAVQGLVAGRDSQFDARLVDAFIGGLKQP